MRTLIRTDEIPDGEQFSRWRDMALNLPAPVNVRAQQTTAFKGWLQITELDAVNVLSIYSRSRYEFERTPALIRRSDPEGYRLIRGIRGEGGVVVGDDEVPVNAGDVVLLDTSRPFRGWRGHGDELVDWTLLTVPRAALPLPDKMVRRLVGVRLASGTGIGALISDFLQHVVRFPEHYRQSDRSRLATAIADLLAVLIAHELEAEGTAPAESRRGVLTLRILDFIGHHLSDQELGPEYIAAAHHISVRQLHKLFSDEDRTVGAWIRSRRLDACRRDLADPLLRDTPVHAIAARWGFPSAAHFSRVFRAHFGMAPQEYRDTCFEASTRGQSPGTFRQRQTASARP
jgi:AraC-like DNA-binding protein